MSSSNAGPLEIYQFRIVLKEVSPLIWRRILVKETTSIADLHCILQIILEWSDTYLNKFKIHGKEYGVYHGGGISFSDNAKEVYLKDFQFRLNEKFTYEYNFWDKWEYELRFEKVFPINSKTKYPYCLDGGRTAPPEDCGGPLAFLELDRYYCPWQIEENFFRLLVNRSRALKAEEKENDDMENEAHEDEDEDGYADANYSDGYYADYYDEGEFEEKLDELRYWYNRNKFKRHEVNQVLRTKFHGEETPNAD